MSGLIAFVFVVLTALLQLTASSYSSSADQILHRTKRVIGGQAATPGQFPFAVALFYHGSYICTASIISPFHVLTAAHCVNFSMQNAVTHPAEGFHAIANVSNAAPEFRIEFSRVTPHPDYNEREIKNDVAILETKEAVPFQDSVQPICIASADTDTRINGTAIVMGWGANRRLASNSHFSDILMWANQKIVPNRLCSIAYLGHQISPKQLCAGFFNGACRGDGGGPLVVDKNGVPIQVGITSYENAIFGCGSLAPAVFSRVSSYNDFIRKETRGHVCERAV